jgi:hypothetical protein
MMATRRIRATINNKYVQPLKLKTGRRLVIAPNVDYISVLFTKKHKAINDECCFKTKVWAKFDGQNFDGIHMVAALYGTNEALLTSSSCVFRVYYVDADQNWGQTLVYTGNGTLQNGLWVLPATQANLGPTTELDGERTLMIEATITRLGKEYKSSVYVNHLGIFDSMFRLKGEIEFLSLTKQDE